MLFGFKDYDLNGPESLTFHDVARTIGDERGKLVTYVLPDSERLLNRKPRTFSRFVRDFVTVFAPLVT